MGLIQHNALVVTTFDEDRARAARAYAAELFGEHMVTGTLRAQVNCYVTFFVGPDGSKEGWDTSDDHDGKRESFNNYLRSFDYEDGSNPFDWVEVSYGELRSEIVDGHTYWEDREDVA